MKKMRVLECFKEVVQFGFVLGEGGNRMKGCRCRGSGRVAKSWVLGMLVLVLVLIEMLHTNEGVI